MDVIDVSSEVLGIFEGRSTAAREAALARHRGSVGSKRS
jgi:hypothetical protein